MRLKGFSLGQSVEVLLADAVGHMPFKDELLLFLQQGGATII